MPSGNTNVMKEYILNYENIKHFFDTQFHSDANEYIGNCINILELCDYFDDLNEEVKKCKKFIDQLSLVLNVNQMKNDQKYRVYIENAREFLSCYETQICTLKPYIDNWNNS